MGCKTCESKKQNRGDNQTQDGGQNNDGTIIPIILILIASAVKIENKKTFLMLGLIKKLRAYFVANIQKDIKIKSFGL